MATVAFRIEGPHSTPPLRDDEAILAAIKNNRPEDISGLAWTKPNFSASGHKIVQTFSIDGKKRPDREYIRCAICSSEHPKFLEGAVLWSPDKWLRLIGHVCAAKPEHFGEAGYRALQRAREQEERDEVAFNWLHANVPRLPAASAGLAQLKAFALLLEDRQKLFFGKVTALAEQLETSVRHGGILSVEQELAGARFVAAELGSSAVGRFESVTLGILEGQGFMRRPRRKRSQQLDGNLQALALIPEGQGDDPILTLIDSGGERAVTIAAMATFRALQNATKLASESLDAPRFFSDENLSLLEMWGQDSRNPMQFSLRRVGPNVTFKLEDRSQVTLPVAWPAPPDLSVLHRIVDAGAALNEVLKREGAQEAAAGDALPSPTARQMERTGLTVAI